MSDPAAHPRWLLHRADGAAVAVFAAVALTAMFGWWAAEGGRQGQLIEIDRAGPLHARFEVDVNAADVPELMLLPGIGPTLAGQIVESRRTAGPFTARDDLQRVRGIGRKRLDRIRPYLRPLPGETM